MITLRSAIMAGLRFRNGSGEEVPRVIASLGAVRG